MKRALLRVHQRASAGVVIDVCDLVSRSHLRKEAAFLGDGKAPPRARVGIAWRRRSQAPGGGDTGDQGASDKRDSRAASKTSPVIRRAAARTWTAGGVDATAIDRS